MSDPSPAKPDLHLDFSGVSKSFGGALALDGASLAVRRGTVHGIVGQNGAGKSTLIKILAGLHKPDAGTLLVDGVSQPHLTPALAEELGIHFIHQDRLLVRSFTVGEALFLGREPRLPGTPFLDRRRMQREADAVINRYFGLSIPNGRLISELSTAERQIVQITRALIGKPAVLVFDEPTAALVRREADLLFGLIRRLRDEGITILYISHYLNEIEALCDDVTVLRNGRTVAALPVANTSARDLARLMIDADLKELFPVRTIARGETVLEVDALSLKGRYEDVSLTLVKGEVLGITGLLGSGAKEFVRTLFGLEAASSGEIRVRGQRVKSLKPPDAIGRQLALVPEDRRGQGVALDLSVAENTTLSSLGRFSRFSFLARRAEKAAVQALIQRLQVKTSGPDALLGTLSGGNQQKVAIAKWLSAQSEIYLLDEPTVGVDVGSKAEIYALINELAEKGAAVIVLSSDLPELIGLSDRILVFFRGQVIRELSAASVTPDQLLAEATGSHIREELAHVG